jgi:hypothetical protein
MYEYFIFVFKTDYLLLLLKLYFGFEYETK